MSVSTIIGCPECGESLHVESDIDLCNLDPSRTDPYGRIYIDVKSHVTAESKARIREHVASH
jgi:hypothetical protein